MRSVTSYFNGALYRKTMARFWPLWGLWGIVWLFLNPLRLLNSYLTDYHWRATSAQECLLWDSQSVPEVLALGVGLALFFSVLCAMAVFGYLYNSRSACWFHALPMRREALFITQYLAGLSFLLLPVLISGMFTAIVELSFLPMVNWSEVLRSLLIWLLAQSGICLFFFSFAAFCAMFTGHILALPAFYFILNFLAAGIWYLLDALMNEFYYGYASMPRALTIAEYLTPSVALREAVYWGYGEAGDQIQAPGTVMVYVLVGVALFFASLLVYRRRHVETAGDVVAVPLVRPLFKYGVSFCAGLAFGMFTAAFFGWNQMSALIPCVLIWSVIGYFVAEMLLRKSFRVLKAWKGAAVMATAVLLLCLACAMDFFGVESRVPTMGQVELVEVSVRMGYPRDDGNMLDTCFKDPAQIEKILALHQAIVDNRKESDSKDSFSGYTSVYLHYTLANGKELNRRYYNVHFGQEDLEKVGSVPFALQQITQDRDLVALAYNFEGFMNNSRLTTAYLSGLSLNGEYYGNYVYVDDYRQELWEAVQQDFAEGNIGVRYLFEDSREAREEVYNTEIVFEVTYDKNADVSAGYEDGNYTTVYSDRRLSIALTPNAQHTLTVLDKTGVFEEGYSLVSYEDEEGTDLYPITESW